LGLFNIYGIDNDEDQIFYRNQLLGKDVSQFLNPDSLTPSDITEYSALSRLESVYKEDTLETSIAEKRTFYGAS